MKSSWGISHEKDEDNIQCFKDSHSLSVIRVDMMNAVAAHCIYFCKAGS
jgi:hypothetical protein